MICKYRIGDSEPNLIPFFVLGISPPNTSQYKPYTKSNDQSDGGMIQTGYKTLTLTWSNVTTATAYRIKQRVIPTQQLFITAPKNDGTTTEFYNFSGYPQPIQVREGSKTYGKGMYYQDLTLTLNNVTVLGVA